MSDTIEIQLGTAKNLEAVNVDQSVNLGLQTSQKEILNYNESSVISAADLFDKERQESEVYRVYGSINFLSIINGLKKDYEVIEDFFTPIRLGSELQNLVKNLVGCFNVYLCYPSSGNTLISGDTYIRNYVVVSEIGNVEIYKSGYARNIFFNFIQSFDFNTDFNIEGYLDSFGKPITEFYLFFDYKASNENGNAEWETISRKDFTTNTFITGSTGTTQILTVGDVLMGDLVEYIKLNYVETLVEKMEYRVKFPYLSGVTLNYLEFKYNPFVPIKVRDFSEEIVMANVSGGTESDMEIPYYAVSIDNAGNVIWKDLLPNGYIDPVTGNGVDFPFVNKRQYLFTNITLPFVPNLEDSNTEWVFRQIKFGPNSRINTKPSSNLNALGNKCAKP